MPVQRRSKRSKNHGMLKKRKRGKSCNDLATYFNMSNKNTVLRVKLPHNCKTGWGESEKGENRNKISSAGTLAHVLELKMLQSYMAA